MKQYLFSVSNQIHKIVLLQAIDVRIRSLKSAHVSRTTKIIRLNRNQPNIHSVNSQFTKIVRFSLPEPSQYVTIRVGIKKHSGEFLSKFSKNGHQIYKIATQNSRKTNKASQRKLCSTIRKRQRVHRRFGNNASPSKITIFEISSPNEPNFLRMT